MITVAKWSHEWLLKDKLSGKTLVDMTAGKGQDTLFLASLSHDVYAFDIQEEAIATTSELLRKNHVDWVKLINDDHAKIDEYIKVPIQGAIYNLGYLPGGKKKIRTTAESTLTSLEKLLKMLSPGGIVVIVVYQKHEGNESQLLLRFVERLPGQTYDVSKHSVLNKELAPYIIVINKAE
ncbi:MAG TPA: class I SAM-dependent methyltransferase [Bacillota bacterium]|nr:class I SAM-dependent methyltransferase [Bacillota bacterium]